MGGRRGPRVATLAAVVACAFGCGCTIRDAAPEAPLARGVTFDISADPRTLDPLFAHVDSGAVEPELARLAFEPFFDLDERGRPVPALLREMPTRANGGVSPDGRTLRYHLRHGIRWSDGVPVTSRDVLFTLRAILDPSNPVASREGYDRIVRAEAPDARTVVFHLRAAWAPAVLTYFAYGATPQFVLPEHVLAAQAPLERAPFGGAPSVGDGPFRFVEWRRGDGLAYVANPRYWRGPPGLARLDVRVVPDPNTNLLLMRTGAIDFNLLAPVQIASLAGRPGIRFRDVPTAIVAGLALATMHEPMNDVRIRRVVAESIDRAAISRLITLGHYPVANSDRPRFSFAYDPALRQPAFDPARADRDLDAAGWHPGREGVRIKDGHVLAMTYVAFPESTTGIRVAVFIQEELRDRGFLIDQKAISNEQLFLPEFGTLARGEFDAAYVPFAMGADPDDRFVYGCAGAEQNYMHYCDPTVERLEARAASAGSERARHALYATIDRIVARDVPVLWLFRANYTYAYRARLGGFSPNAFSPTWNAWQWRVR